MRKIVSTASKPFILVLGIGYCETNSAAVSFVCSQVKMYRVG